ncbi:FtsQ-type POTRA domain-containing protein [Streptomyces sp. NPDC008139]|uniref:cell division protein FtsQ/DivIB n=1 Tax=Streptomyces sp. NPDC008139 TaxID=3364814 RepID=UPI0036E93F9A
MTGTQAKPVGADRDGAASGTGRRPRPRPTLPSRRTAIITLVVLTVLVAGGTWAVYGSSWFRATRVTVTGNDVLTPQQIERAAGVPLGGALVSVDTGAVRRRLLAALPRIGHVDVERSWPHTVRVKVTERTASAVLKSGDKFTEVDPGGVRFATVDTAPRGVPLVQLTPDQSPSLRHFGTKSLLRAAIAVAADLPESLHGQATAIRVRSYDNITVELSRGRSVMWGSAEQGARKAAVLNALLKVQPHASHYDVSAPSAPAASGS